MLKKTITYTDYNGVERTEDFWFNFSQAEILEMEIGRNGGISEYLKKIIESKDQEAIVKNFKELILKAYGEKSEDGRRFVKSPELSKAFSETEAYSKLYLELAFDAKAASNFVNNVIPSNVDLPSKAEPVKN